MSRNEKRKQGVFAINEGASHAPGRDDTSALHVGDIVLEEIGYRGRNRIGQFLRSRSWRRPKGARLPELPCPDSRLSQANFRIGAYADPDCLAAQLSHR